MEEMVVLKYHGIRLGTNSDGTPELKRRYRGGMNIDVNVGGYTDPMPLCEARRLISDFGKDAWEVVARAGIPETDEEIREIEKDGVEIAVKSTEQGDILVEHIAEAEVVQQEQELIQSESDDIKVVRKVRADVMVEFDKTEEPIKFSRSALGRMSKSQLRKVFKTAYSHARGVKPKLRLTDKKNDIIKKILDIQGE